MFELTKLAQTGGLSLKAPEFYRDPSGHISWQVAVHVDGTKVANLKYEGWGGKVKCIVHSFDKAEAVSAIYSSMIECMSRKDSLFNVKVSDIVKSFNFESQLIEMTIMLMTEFERISALKRQAESNILLIDPADPFKTAIIRHPPTEENLAKSKAEFPYLNIINHELDSISL